jgi:hypothetical protein
MLDLGFKLLDHPVEVGHSGSTSGPTLLLAIPVSNNLFLDVLAPPVPVPHPEDPLRQDADIKMPALLLRVQDHADLRVTIPAFDVLAYDWS